LLGLLHGNCCGIRVVAAGIARLRLKSVGLSCPCQGSASIWTCWSASINASCSAAEVNLELMILLKLGDTGQLEIERVHDHPGHDIQHVEDQPSKEHDDMVGEDHVVDDEAIDPSYDPPGRKYAHGYQPTNELGLFLLPESVEGVAACDENGDGSKKGEQSAHEEKVPHMMVSNVNEFKRDEVVSIVSCAWLGFLQDIDLKTALK